MTEAERQYYTQREEFERYAREILDLVPVESGRLLDVGCGLGWVVAEAGRRGFKAMGIDKKPDYVRIGRKYLRADLRTVSLEKFVSRQKFAVIILKHVLEHAEDTGAFLGKAHQLLKHDGYMIVACPNNASLMHWIFGRRWYGRKPTDHKQQFTAQTLTETIKNSGLTVEKVVINNLGYNIPGVKGLVFALLLKIADWTKMGDQTIIIARKI